MSVAGKWNVDIETPAGTKHGVLELVVDGAVLTGSLRDAEHFAIISDGWIEGNRLQWSAKLTKPMRMTFKFSAIVEDDRITGKAKHLLGSATFSGTRA